MMYLPSTVLLLRTTLTRMQTLFLLLCPGPAWNRTLRTGWSFLTSLVTMWALRSDKLDLRSPMASVWAWVVALPAVSGAGEASSLVWMHFMKIKS